jgi:hypothetical protein
LSVQRRFDRQWEKHRAAGKKHARLMQRKPELRDQLYGREGSPPDQKAGSRETAQKGNDDG